MDHKSSKKNANGGGDIVVKKCLPFLYILSYALEFESQHLFSVGKVILILIEIVLGVNSKLRVK